MTHEASAERAYEYFCEGLTSGRWGSFFDLLAAEVDLLWPYPPNAGEYSGADGRDKLIEFCGQLGGEDNRLTDIDVTRRSVAEDSVVFEDHSQGVFGGQPYDGRHCVILTMRDERVVGFREYTAPA
jgi:ketosteroid isomerase-like protein